MPDHEALKDQSPWWTGIFLCISAFNNTGLSLIDVNMVPFQGSYYVVITTGLLILAGNTAYPIFLRFILWGMLKLMNFFMPDDAFVEWKETFEFILKYPRRVYTTLFPSRLTWWLLAVVVFINVADWLAFELLDLGNPAVTALPIGDRIIDGLFQGIGTSSTG
jgi:Trk-type K+ transport system membrane component